MQEAIKKLEHYCSYQERCHQEVTAKLQNMALTQEEKDQVVVHLITTLFLNETRFARSYARGKHRIKGWGKIRIVNELKRRDITQTNITIALQEISESDYLETLNKTALLQWEYLREPNFLKKKKKFCDYLIRKGYESTLVYSKWQELSME